jgi:hypothetical protein
MASLAIQTVGGVEVSNARDMQAASHGGSVMRAGIIFQFSNTASFAALLLAAQLRLRKKGVTVSRSAGRPTQYKGAWRTPNRGKIGLALGFAPF